MPNLIGLTIVRLLEVKGNLLTVSGLDAVESTPILDIKPVEEIIERACNKERRCG
jgi:tRNA (Thr-GGU) A37 N-methylase